MISNFISERMQKIKPSPIRTLLNKITLLRKEGKSIIDLSIGRPFFDTPDVIKEKTIEALKKGNVHYTNSMGEEILRKALQKRIFQDKGVYYDEDEILITVGGTEGMFLTLQAIINPGDEVIVPSPMYVYYRGWIEYSLGKCIEVPLKKDSFSLDLEEITNHINDRTKAIIINSPHNPTGVVFNEHELYELSKIAKEHNLIVISDEIYQRIVFDMESPKSIASFDGMKEHTVITDSFSKTYAMDGWRIGYVAANRDTVKELTKLHQHVVSCHNTFLQIGTAMALEESESDVKSMVNIYKKNRDFICNRLEKLKMPFIYPEGAFYVFVKIKQLGFSSMEASEFLLNKGGVAVVPGIAFSEAGEGYIRISFSPPQNELEEGMYRIEKALFDNF